MADHSRLEPVDVEQIMRQIRARISERRGADYTEPEVQQLAASRLEAILDPRHLPPPLLDQLKRGRTTAPAPSNIEPAYTFEDTTLFESTRAPLRWIRRLLLPILKLFFNPNPLIAALHVQARLNVEAAERDARRDQTQAEWNALYYDVIRALVNDVSRSTLDVRALRLKLESLQGRLEFAERRVRGLESAVQARGGRGGRETREREPRVEPPQQPESRPEIPRPSDVLPAAAGAEAPGGVADAAARSGGAPVEGTEPRRRRRRRRRGRRGGAGPAAGAETAAGALAEGNEEVEDGAEGDEDAAVSGTPEDAAAPPSIRPPDDSEPPAQ